MAVRRGFRAAYDSLGLVVASSLAIFCLAVGIERAVNGLGGIIGLAVGAVGLCVAYVFASALTLHAHRMASHDYPCVGDIPGEVTRVALPALKLLLIDLVISVVVLGDTLFVFRIARGALGVIGLGFFLCASVLWLMMSVYHLPLLAAQFQMESGPRPFVVLRKSFLLTVDNPGFTLVVLVVIIALGAVCAVPAMVGWAIFFPGAAAFLAVAALRELFVKYGVVESEPEHIDDNS